MIPQRINRSPHRPEQRGPGRIGVSFRSAIGGAAGTAAFAYHKCVRPNLIYFINLRPFLMPVFFVEGRGETRGGGPSHGGSLQGVVVQWASTTHKGLPVFVSIFYT